MPVIYYATYTVDCMYCIYIFQLSIRATCVWKCKLMLVFTNSVNL